MSRSAEIGAPIIFAAVLTLAIFPKLPTLILVILAVISVLGGVVFILHSMKKEASND